MFTSNELLVLFGCERGVKFLPNVRRLQQPSYKLATKIVSLGPHVPTDGASPVLALYTTSVC